MKGTAEPSGAVPFVLITGGKGGVGKTTLAANLGVELARAGVRPLAVDLDLGLADLAVVLRLEPERDVESLLEGGRSLEECLTEGPAGLRVLAAGGETRDAGKDGERRRHLFASLRRPGIPTGLVLGDSPAGIGPDVLECAAHADRVLVVTTPEPAALTDAYSVVKAIDAHAESEAREIPTPDVFVNLATDASHARSVAGRLRAVCERFLCRSPRLLGWMPRSRGVLAAAARQEAFVLADPRSVPSRAVRQLARRFSDLAADAQALMGAPQGVCEHGR